jgi:hypothetical protein
MTKIYLQYDKNKMQEQEYFPVTSVARADLEGRGFSTARVSDATMTRLAEKMGEAYTEQNFWIDLDIIAEYLGIPKRVQ